MKLKNEEEIPAEVLRSFSFPGDHEESRRQFAKSRAVALRRQSPTTTASIMSSTKQDQQTRQQQIEGNHGSAGLTLGHQSLVQSVVNLSCVQALVCKAGARRIGSFCVASALARCVLT